MEIFYLSHFLNLLYHKLFSLSSIFFIFFFGGCSSCRPLSRALGLRNYPLGSHLYPAQQDSARWGHWVGRGTPLLVGLTDSRGSHSSLCRTFPRPLCTYYSTLCGVCQELFFRFLIFFVGLGFLSLSTLRIYYSKKFSKLQVVKVYKISGGQRAKIVQNFFLTKCVTRGIIEKSRGPGRPRATQEF